MKAESTVNAAERAMLKKSRGLNKFKHTNPPRCVYGFSIIIWKGNRLLNRHPDSHKGITIPCFEDTPPPA
jgi:hypothetical protein